jgi:hypothetical protein
MSGGGLKPPAPSSVEPSGIPTRPTVDAEPIPIGDEADAAGDPDGPLTMAAQVPEAVPAIPPPSKTVLEPEVPAAPWASEPPAHVAVAPVAGPSGDAPDDIGLTPGDASSVAPSGMPVGATGEPGPMPSGDVMPSGDGPLPPICAEAGPAPNNAVAITATVIRLSIDSTLPSKIRRTALRRPAIGLRRRDPNLIRARRPAPFYRGCLRWAHSFAKHILWFNGELPGK